MSGSPSLDVTPLKNPYAGGVAGAGGGSNAGHNDTRDLVMQLGGGESGGSTFSYGGSGVSTPLKQQHQQRPPSAGEGIALQGYSANSPGAIARGGRLPSSGSPSKGQEQQQRGIRPLNEGATSETAVAGGDAFYGAEGEGASNFPTILAGVGQGAGHHPQGRMSAMEEAELHSKMQQLHLQGQMALGATDAIAAGGGNPNTNTATGDRRSVSTLSKKQSESQLSSARAMARKVSSGGHATTDAARLLALEEECRALTMQVHNQEKGLIQVNIEWDKSKKQVGLLGNKLDKEVSTNKDLTNKLKVAESQLALTKREMAMVQRQATKGAGASSSSASTAGGVVNTTGAARAAAQELHQKDMQLKRALEDLEKCQTQLRSNEKENGGGGFAGSAAEQKQQLQHLITENKKMDAQRVELLACVRKQAKLIDVLKRQKMHLEAAKLLQITEAEFTKALECNLEA